MKAKKKQEEKRRKYFTGCASEYYLKTGKPLLYKEKLKEAHKITRKNKSKKRKRLKQKI